MLAVPPAAVMGGFAVRESERVGFAKADLAGGVVRNYFWLFAAAVVLVGGMTGGAVAAIYPGYTGNNPSVLALQLATINIATVVAVLVAPPGSTSVLFLPSGPPRS
ncbi:hypothetical protein [Methanoculleus chikugoensis]|uniref:hypothetical protein n=1 Tax=Methanoculleus chikugoensis TaxID=118126 RepID=UPI000B02EB89|nr:hypothetical protein [Methanoculleus chikugoensis]